MELFLLSRLPIHLQVFLQKRSNLLMIITDLCANVRNKYTFIADCDGPPEHPNATVTLMGKGATNYSLGAQVTYVCPCGYWWKKRNSSSIQSECKGSLGWTIHKDALRAMNCTPIPTSLFCPEPRNGSNVELVETDAYTKCYNLSSIPPLQHTFPGVTLRYRCISPMFRFPNGMEEVEIFCKNNTWIPSIELNCYG